MTRQKWFGFLFILALIAIGLFLFIQPPAKNQSERLAEQRAPEEGQESDDFPADSDRRAHSDPKSTSPGTSELESPKIESSVPESELVHISFLVLDPLGSPVENAMVNMVQTSKIPNPEIPNQPRLPEDDVWQAGTDESGGAVLAIKLPSGVFDWTVNVGKERFEDFIGEWHGSARGGLDREDSIVLDTGLEQSSGTPEDPFVIHLPFETSITGRALLPDDQAASNACLVAIQRDTGNQGWAEPDITQVEDEAGSYYFGPLQPGRYWVWAYQPEFARSAKVVVEVAEGERAFDVNIELELGFEAVITVLDQLSGRPIEGATVYPHLEHVPGTVDFPHRSNKFDARVRNVAATNRSGIADLFDLPLRRTLLRVLHPDYRIAETWIEPDASEVVHATIGLETGPSIRGDVVDAKGNLVDGAEIFAVTMSLNRDLSEVLAGEIIDGSYEIAHVNPAQYVVVYPGQSADGSDTKIQFTMVSLEKDAVVDFVEVAELATLSGLFVGSDEKPVGNKFVTVSRVDDFGELSFRSGLTDADGRFEIRNLTLAEWTISVSSSPESMVAIATLDLREPIDYEEQFTVPQGEIYGRVTDAAGRAAHPVELFIFQVDSVSSGSIWRGRCEADHEGVFRFQGLTEGSFSLFAQSPGYRQTTSRPIELPSGGEAEFDLVLERGGSVRVTVQDSNDAPQSGLDVRILNRDGRVINEGLPARTDESGVYLFTSLGPGEFRIHLSSEGSSFDTEEQFTAKMGETVEVLLEVPR